MKKLLLTLTLLTASAYADNVADNLLFEGIGTPGTTKMGLISSALYGGANINALDLQGCTPLFRAVACYNDELVEQFINHGAECNFPYLLNPFLLAVRQDCRSMINTMLERCSTDLSLLDEALYIAVHAPLTDSRLLTIQDLIRSGASPWIEFNGEAAYDVVVQKGNTYLIECFKLV